MESVINKGEVKLAMEKIFDYLSANNIPIVLEMDSIGRICTFSARTDEPISYSWLKLDLVKYKGFKEVDGEVKIFFFCNIYKNIYFLKEHFDYIYQSAIKHSHAETVKILREYIIDREERYGQRQIQAKAC